MKNITTRLLIIITIAALGLVSCGPPVLAEGQRFVTTVPLDAMHTPSYTYGGQLSSGACIPTLNDATQFGEDSTLCIRNVTGGLYIMDEKHSASYFEAELDPNDPQKASFKQTVGEQELDCDVTVKIEKQIANPEADGGIETIASALIECARTDLPLTPPSKERE